MKTTFLGFLLSGLLLSAAEGKFIRKASAEKLEHTDLSFAVTFDNYSVNADLARGNKECLSGKNTNLALRGTLGFDNQQGFVPLPGEELVYDAVNNASAHNGTVSLWLNARDFNPTIDSGRANMAILRMQFSDEKRWISYVIYEYKGTIWADWKSSEAPHRWSDTCSLSMPAKEHHLTQNQYFQLVYTWSNSNEVALYCNGKLIMNKVLPEKWVKTADLVPGNSSRIIIRPNILADKKQDTLEMDDVLIYSRALTPLEVANLYRSSLKDPSQAEHYRSFTVKLNGIDRGKGKDHEVLEAEFDLSGIPADTLSEGITMDYHLSGPNGFHRAGKWDFRENQHLQYVTGLTEPGQYRLTVQYGKEEFAVSIERPALAFLDNPLGQNAIPELWKDFKVTGRKITLWNRRYHFGEGPFPTAITVADDALLEQAPVLLINGKMVTDWQSGESKQKDRSVVYYGTGKFPGGTLRYHTEVAFDGLIDCRFAIDGQPMIHDMRIEWQVAKAYTQFLMLPELYEKVSNPARFNLNFDMDRAVELWFVTEKKGGFCWSYENDANWIYEPSDKILSADINTGKCSVQMINKEVVVPDDSAYNALFIATPVRPLPKRIRNLRWGGGGSIDLLHGRSGCLTGPTNFEPHPTEFSRQMKAYPPGKFAINGLAMSMTAADPIAVYFEKYCEVPGASNYDIPYSKLIDGKLVPGRYRTISTCNQSFVNDLFLWNIQKLLTHPMGDRIAMIYYDLCGNGKCRNLLHGCRFKDRFGRLIDTWRILSERDLVIRTVTYAHSQGRQVFLHGQRSFYPMLQGTADYWFPGEEHMSLFMRNPFGSTDELSDNLYRSEFNRNVRGMGCIVLPAVTMKENEMRDPLLNKASEAYAGMLLLHDVEFWNYHFNFSVYKKIYDIKAKYRFEDAEAFPYYTENGIVSDAPSLRITRYLCPGAVNLLVVMNKEPRSCSGTLDFSAISQFSGKLTEEYTGEELLAENSRVKIKVPARSFRIIAVK